MRYNQPYGGSTNAPYVNGDPSAGIQGSVVPAEALEYPQRELVNLVTKSAFTPDNADLTQLAKAVQSGRVCYGVDTGSANAWSIALDPVLLAYTVGLRLLVLVSNNVTGAVTLNVNGLGAKAVVRPGNNAMVSGDVGAGDLVDVGYDGTRFQMLSIFKGIATGGAPVLAPGVTVIVDPVTALLEQARPRTLTTGANYTYVAGDRGRLRSRANAGSAMADTLPGGGSVLPQGWLATVRNDNGTPWGALTITPAGGTTIDGVTSFKLSPGASATIVSDGTNYWTCNETVLADVVGGTSNGNLTAATIWRCTGGLRMCSVWGSVSNVAQFVSASITLPVTYGTASYIINTGVAGATFAGPCITSGGQGTSGFSVQNVSGTAGIINIHWNTWGLL